MDVFRHSGNQFALGDAADGREFRVHRDVTQVVQCGEDAELAEFGYSCYEAELHHAFASLEGLEELLHQLAYGGEALVVHHLKQRSVILVDDYHNLAPCFVVCVGYRFFQTLSRGVFIHVDIIFTAVWR